MKKVCLLLFIVSGFLYSIDIEVVTEQYPPFNFEKDGFVQGVATEVVQAVLEELEIEKEIKVMRWGRAYRRATRRANVLIYSIGRTADREELFHWVGIVAPLDIYLYSKSRGRSFDINKEDDLKHFSIGVVEGDMRDQYFSLNKDLRIKRYKNSRELFNALVNKEIDLLPAAQLNFPYLVEHLGYNLDEFRELFFIEELSNEGLYMAFGKRTELKIVHKFRNALEKIDDK